MINMIDVDEVRNNLEALAIKLESSDPNAALRLRNLSRAVDNGPNADAWASSNIHQLVEPELIFARYKNQKKTDTSIAWMEWVRNTLIFAPLVVTWYGISQAVEKYSDLIAANGNDIYTPFLYLWQQGFGGRLQGWQTLGGLATIDFILLAVVLGLTIAVYALNNSVKLRREQEAEELRATLMHTLAGASLCLTTRNWQQPTSVIGLVNQSVTRFDQVIGQLLGQMKTIADRQAQEQQTFDLFKRDLVNIMDSMSKSVGSLKTSNEALVRSIGALVPPTQEVASKIGGLATNAESAVAMFQSQIAAQQAVLASQEKWGNDLNVSLGNLARSVQVALNLANGMADFTKKQSDLVDAMRDERNAQAQISGQVQLSAQMMRGVIADIQKCAADLNGIIVHIDGIARRAAGVR
jgi:hypothetical protein